MKIRVLVQWVQSNVRVNIVILSVCDRKYSGKLLTPVVHLDNKDYLKLKEPYAQILDSKCKYTVLYIPLWSAVSTMEAWRTFCSGYELFNLLNFIILM